MPPRRKQLEQVHGYVTDRFPRLTSETLARFELDATRLDDFEREGFVGPVRVLDHDVCGDLAARIDAIGRDARELESELYEVELAWREHPDRTVFHCLGGWRIDDLLHDLVFHPGVTVPAAAVLGVDRLRFWHDQVFAKPPHHAGLVPWHQDYSYWQRTAPAAHVTVHIALDRADAENGCIEYVPGSHRWGLWPAAGFDADLDAFCEALPARLQARFTPVPMRLEAGEAALHHSHTVHGSRANRSDRHRRAAVLNYMAADVRSTTDAPLLRGVPAVPRGEVVAGDFFPIVLDRAALESCGHGEPKA